MEVSFDETELVVEANQAIIVPDQPAPRAKKPILPRWEYTKEMEERHKMLQDKLNNALD